MVETLTADKAAKMAMQQLDACQNFKQERLAQILEMQEAIYGKFRPMQRGRSGIPMPFFSKYVNELKARIDDSPVLKFKHTKDSQILLARKVQGKCDIDRSPSEGDWNRVDRQAKFMAITSGVIVYDYFAESTPEYHSNLEAVDVFDFFFEPTGGNDLEKHAFIGKGNIFRSESELRMLADEGIYIKENVETLISNSSGDKYKTIQKQYLNRYERFKAMGLDMSAGETSYIGESFYALAQWQMQIGGERYYLVFDMISGIALRFEKLKDVFESNLYSMVLAQTHEDPHTVLCKSPGDDMWPIAEWLRVQSNYFIDHVTKEIWGMKGYDPNFFPDPSQLEWYRPDQLVIMQGYQGKPLEEGFVEFTTPDKTSVNINVMQYFEGMLASLAGVSPQEGSMDDQKVGVLFGNLQKVSALLGVYNKSYSEAWHKIATRYVWGLKEHMDETTAVKIMGERGAEWEEFAQNELKEKSDFEIEVVGANVELEMSEAKKKKQADYVTSVLANPTAIQEFNVRVLLEEGARSVGYDEGVIRRMMDKDSYGSERIVSHASMAIEQILRKKNIKAWVVNMIQTAGGDAKKVSQLPTKTHADNLDKIGLKLYQGADINFLKYLNDYVTETDLDPEQSIAIQMYGQAHLPIVARNMAIKASTQLAQQGMPPNGQPPTPNAKPVNAQLSPGAGAPPMPANAAPAGAPPGAVPPNPVR